MRIASSKDNTLDTALFIGGNSTSAESTSNITVKTDNEMQINNGTSQISIEKDGNTSITGTSNNVGIGTNDPKQKLHVQGDLKIASSLDGTSDTMLYLGGNSSSTTSNSQIKALKDDGNLEILNGTSKISIEKNGNTIISGSDTNANNVGIGTDSPQSILHISGTTKLDGEVNVMNNFKINHDTVNTKTTFKDLNNIELMSFSSNNTSINADTISFSDSAGTHSQFSNNKLGIGIGETIPQANLHIYEPSTDNSSTTFMIGQSGDNNAFIQKYDSTGNKFIAGHSNVSNSISNANSFTMDSSGNIGIGNTIPDKKLHVTGSAKITDDLSVGNTMKVNKLIIGNTDVTDDITGTKNKIEFKNETDSSKDMSAVVSYNSSLDKSVFEVRGSDETHKIRVDDDGNLIVKNNINFSGKLLLDGNDFITNPKVIETILLMPITHIYLLVVNK